MKNVQKYRPKKLEFFVNTFHCIDCIDCIDIIDFLSKIEILVKHGKFGQESKFWSRIEISVKNRNLGQESKIWSRIVILVKNRHFGRNLRTKILKYNIFLFRFDQLNLLKLI